ncbi:6-hydroxymethylpterin diphosphokinase MptE-like protein [Solidesulfovibrio sp.]|uniref:motility associated factor glycosyltransferase family protein n=1 Tax=Solidesulfovibrio sp. TaxID=2910990 RepID=UPI00262686E2|nr:6-hydroxymethylpterin diphosphokinase MptE-like protein [Solidesulfovibrio sp.]
MAITSFLVDNLTALAEAGAPAAAWLARHNPDPEGIFGRIFKNRHGSLDWRMDGGQGIFEALPPAVHYRDWRPTENLVGGATVIVGTGLGYGLNHVLTGVPPSHRLLVVEPRPEMLMACLSQTDYRPFTARGQLIFLPPDRALLEKALHGLDVSFLYARINVRNDMPSFQLGPEYARLAALVRAILENMAVELNTLRLKQEVMVGNELRNFSRAMDDGSLSRMAGKAQGLTAVIFGAGPSLPLLAPAVARHRDKALFASALQTLPVLERLGIKPHLCLAIDFNTDMTKCLDNLVDPAFAADVPLIYSTKMQPEVLDRYPGPRIPLWTEGGMGTYVLKDLELVLDAGGNVGVTLERFLTWAGARRFVLVGQDLSWRGGSTHAPGHHSASPEGGGKAAAPRGDAKLKNLDGEDIFTHLGFLAAKRDMEKDIAASGALFHNLYGGGAVIEGAVVIGPEALDDPAFFEGQATARDAFLDALGRAATPRARPVFSQKAGQWASSLKNAARRLEKLMRKADKHQAEIRELLGQIQLFLRHDPLYLPYLYNDIMELAGLIQTRTRFGVKELTQFQAIRKRVQDKTREIDALLGPSGSWAA